MADGRSDDPFAAGRRRRRSVPNEAGLRALGSEASGPGDSVPNESGLRALGAQIDRTNAQSASRSKSRTKSQRAAHRRAGLRRSGKPRWSRRRKVLAGCLGVLLFLLAIVGAGYLYLQYRFDQLHKVHLAALQSVGNGQPFNMLVLGSDSRVGTNSSAFGSSSVVTGQRSDVIMIWHVDPGNRRIQVMSIPRDTLVSMVGSDASTFGQFNRINSSYNSGANQLVETIEANLGIPISHVVQVDFGGFQGAVDALGGVWLNFPYPARDAFSGLNVTTPGCQLVNGTQALAVARSRHYEYFASGYWQSDGTGDFGRIQRQDAFLRALIDAAESKFNPLTINAFLGSLPQGITIDDQFSLTGLLGLAADFHSYNATALTARTLPTTSIGYVNPWGDVLFVDQPAAQQLMVSIFGSSLTRPTSPPPNTHLDPAPPPDVTATTAPPASATTGTTTTTTPPPSFDPTACSPH
jgi:LCP family protein required for cell wall assembly